MHLKDTNLKYSRQLFTQTERNIKSYILHVYKMLTEKYNLRKILSIDGKTRNIQVRSVLICCIVINRVTNVLTFFPKNI